MQLLRFATLGLRWSADEWRTFRLEHRGVEVSHVESKGAPADVHLIVALAPLDGHPEVGPDGSVQVPDEARRRAEEALQIAADVLSVATGGSRSLSSTSLPVAFRAENADERAWLQSQKGLADWDRGLARPGFTVLLDDRHANALSDRPDGVSLLAEALANTHLTGRFHELLRVFERAFTESADRLVPFLAEFLAARPLLGYTKTEVKRWIVRLRGPATHADREHPIVLEADLRPAIARMTFAAYDVLLNKRLWRDHSVERRDIWRPDIGPLTPDGREIFIRQHSAPQMEAELLDRFGAYRLNLQGGMGELDDDCWPRTGPPNTNAPQGGIQIVPGDAIDKTRADQ